MHNTERSSYIKYIAVCFVVLIMASFAFGNDTAENWFSSWSGKKDDAAHAAVQTADNGYLVGGETNSFGAGGSDILIMKLDSTGSMLWQKTYGSKRNEHFHSIKPVKDNSYVILASTNYFAIARPDILIYKINDSGAIIWQNAYGTHNSELCEGNDLLAETTDDGFMIAGTIKYDAKIKKGTQSHTDIFLMKLNSKGLMLWEKIYDISMLDSIRTIKQTKDGGYILAGYVLVFSLFKGSDYNFWVAKINSEGELQWQKMYGGKDSDQAVSIAETESSEYIVAGNTKSYGAGENDFLVLKLDAKGIIVWQATYGGKKMDMPESIMQTNDNGYLISGITESFGAGKQDILAIKIDGSGDILWQKAYGGKNEEALFNSSATLDGGFILSGTTKSFGNAENDVYLLKMSNNGTPDKTCSFFSQGYANKIISQAESKDTDAKILHAPFDIKSIELIVKESSLVGSILCE